MGLNRRDSETHPRVNNRSGINGTMKMVHVKDRLGDPTCCTLIMDTELLSHSDIGR
jgi:hypothetical protein